MNVSEQDWSAGYRRGYDDAKRDYSNVVEASPVPEVQPAPGDSIPWMELVVVRLENLEKLVASLVGTGSVENREWFLSVDQFISRADKELEEHRRALGRTVKKCRKLDE